MTLRNFLNAPANTVTRERMFFHRLYADLTLAAARAGYPLSIFEPEVDRDKFDVLLDDADNQRRIQLKTFTRSAGTTQWDSNKRFMRPDVFSGDKLRIAPADCGIGGGFVVIEIDDLDENAPVSYFYTDYFIIYALAAGLLGEYAAQQPGPRPRGRPRAARRQLATIFRTNLWQGAHRDDIVLDRGLFLKMRSPDALLALAGFHSTLDCYLPSNHILEAAILGIVADDDGLSREGLDIIQVATAHARMEGIIRIIEDDRLRVFSRR